MFSVFYDEGEGYKLKAILANGAKDIFAKKAIENLNWDLSKLKVYVYDNYKTTAFGIWANDIEPLHKLNVNANTFDLEKIISIPNGSYEKQVAFDAINALDFYTQQEIDDEAHNRVIIEAHLSINPGSIIEPDYLGVAWPVIKTETITNSGGFTVSDSIVGVFVNIAERIVDEDNAIALGKTKLD